MVLFFDRRRNQKVLCSRFNQELTYPAENDESTSFDDVVMIGDRGEPDGTTTESKTNTTLQQSLGNKLQGSIAGILGAKDYGHTTRGSNPQTTNKRRKFLNINLNKGK